MRKQIRFILFFVLLGINHCISAQDTLVQNESILHDKNLEAYTDRSKFRMFFKPVEVAPIQYTMNQGLKQKPYTFFEGKIIRQINIITFDPFGSSLSDTPTTALGFLPKTGNRFHIKTRANTLRNLLLIRENQPFDSLRVNESERLVRSMEYITDVYFHSVFSPESTDSVDVFIRVFDSWSLIPRSSWSDPILSVELSENNFIGLGHKFQNGIHRNGSTGRITYQMKYFIPTIGNTYINSTLQYGTDEYGKFIKGFGLERTFFSPLTKWAGGVSFLQQWQKDSLRLSNTLPYKYNAQDYWLGYSTPVFRVNSEYLRTTRLISAARFNRVRFVENPPEAFDTLKNYSDENFYLGSLGIATRLFIKDRYIFRFGITEDVPIGKLIGMTIGYQEKNNIGRFYLGTRFALGNYYSWGYLSSNIEFGTFPRKMQTEEGVIRARVNYFTGLIETGQWKFRQIIKPQVTIGIHRLDYDRLTINDEYGLRGFNSPALSGVSRLLVTSQTQSYAPWNIFGFHFGPYLNISLAMLGDADKGFQDSKVYSQIGLGVLIKNENLVTNGFQLSISFYPIIPTRGHNIFLLNSFQTTDFGFSDFEIGKPARVIFR